MIWLTRPVGQNEPWRVALEQAGATVRMSPLLEIVPPDDPAQAAEQLDETEYDDIVIAASVNAVAGAYALRPHWAPEGTLLAVGKASARVLGEHAKRSVIAPDRADSEGLLGLPELANVKQRKVTILAGHGGRRLLADTLVARGAQLTKLALYRRRPTEIEDRQLLQLLSTDVIVVTSMDAWSNLNRLAGRVGRSHLAMCRLVVPSQRMVKQACRDVDWRDAPVVMDNMSADGVVATVNRIWSADS